MKNKLLLILLFISCGVNAQIVSMPNEGLKSDLLAITAASGDAKDANGNNISIDANNDGEIQVSEAQAVWYLSTSAWDDMQGMEAFINIREFYFTMGSATTLNFTSFVNLEYLDLDIYSDLQSLNISNLPHLKRLTIMDSVLSQIMWNGTNNLEVIEITAYLNAINLSQFENLKSFHYYGDQIAIDVSENHNLQSFRFYLAHSSDLPFVLTGFENKQELTSFTLEFSYWLPPFPPYPNLPALPPIDLSGCPALNNLSIDLGPTTSPRYLNLKNGVTNYTLFNVNLHPTDFSPVTVCIDDSNQDYFLQHGLNNPHILLNSYCSSGPGGQTNTVEGILSFGTDCSGNSLPANLNKMSITNGTTQSVTFTDTAGEYKFYPEQGSYTVSPQFENNSWYTITPPSATINFANNNNNTATQNFCITPNGVHPDVEVVIVPIGTARPGFDAHYKIIYKNKGNQTLSGSLSMIYNDAVLDYVSATPAYATSAAGQLSWNYSNLAPFENREINVVLNLNGPMETPPANIGDALNYTVNITPAVGDETPSDNTFTFNQEVVGSFDPNDITCLEGDVVHPDKIGQYLHYNINFENTGTVPATFIVVKDIINAQQFDVNTLQVLSASHNVETRVTGNKVEFIFDDINLAAQGKGNVVFKIKTKPTVAVNSTVTQKADIFFDYNWPIVTNDANTTFTILSRGDFAIDNSVKIYPNPAKDVVNVEGSAELKSIQLYDVQGRLLQSVSVSGLQSTVNIASMPKGIYFIKAFTEKGTKLEKIVKE